VLLTGSGSLALPTPVAEKRPDTPRCPVLFMNGVELRWEVFNLLVWPNVACATSAKRWFAPTILIRGMPFKSWAGRIAEPAWTFRSSEAEAGKLRYRMICAPRQFAP